MLSISELPRVDGVVVGHFAARHKSPSYSLEGYGFKFQNGLTGPLQSRIADRLNAAFAGDVSFEPCDEESAVRALQWLQERSPGRVAAVVEACRAKYDPSYQAPSPVTTPAVVAADEKGPLPATWGELAPLGADELRRHCDELGLEYDGRWRAQKLRLVLAEELDLEAP